MRPLRLLLPALLLLSRSADASMLIGLTVTNSLVKFDSYTPGTPFGGLIPITGLLTGGETIRAIDYRPATGQLYGLSSASRLYSINEATGVASFIGEFTPALTGTEFGFDVNPVPDRIRVMSDSGQNFRLNPNNGVAIADTALTYASGDINFGAAPTVTAAAYTDSYSGATSSTLYAIDTNFDVLVQATSQNLGLLATVGPLGLNATSITGFDIDPFTKVALAALDSGASQSSLYAVNLTTGMATSLGAIGGGAKLRGLAVMPFQPAFVGLTTANALIRFNADAPGTIVAGPTPITGLADGEVILSIDHRPATGELYGLSTLSRLFRLNASTGAATLAAALTDSVTGTAWGFDFNPVNDRLRIVSNGGQNLQVIPDTGAVTVNTPLMFAAADAHFGAPPSLAGSAYTNSVFGAATTTLYGIDNALDVLVSQSPPANGTLSTIGALGVNAEGDLGFDVDPGQNAGWAAMVVGGTSRLYKVSLLFGGATLIGSIGGGHQLRGLSFVPFGASPPATVVAVGTTAGGPRVAVLFTTVAGAHHYDIYRRATGGVFELIGSTFATSFLDTVVVPNTSYLYKVRAVGPGGNSTPDSGAEVGTPMTFTDDPMVGVLLVVKAVHLAEVRAGVNLVRALAGLGAAAFTDAAVPGVVVKAIHITELRAALDAARAALGAPAVTYSRTLTPGTTLIASIDVIELRTGIR